MGCCSSSTWAPLLRHGCRQGSLLGHLSIQLWQCDTHTHTWITAVEIRVTWVSTGGHVFALCKDLGEPKHPARSGPNSRAGGWLGKTSLPCTVVLSVVCRCPLAQAEQMLAPTGPLHRVPCCFVGCGALEALAPHLLPRLVSTESLQLPLCKINSEVPPVRAATRYHPRIHLHLCDRRLLSEAHPEHAPRSAMRLLAIASSSCTLTRLLFSSSMFFCVCNSIFAISRCFSWFILPFSVPLPLALTVATNARCVRACGSPSCACAWLGGLEPHRQFGSCSCMLLVSCTPVDVGGS